jgi:hypothetical protein
VSAFVNQSEHMKDVVLNLVVDKVRKWSASATRKSVRSDVIVALPFNDDSHHLFDSVVKVVAQTR